MILSCDDIWFRYRRKGPDVVRGISLSVTEGDSLGIVGESGSGKTTLARILLGTLRPTAGSLARPPTLPGANVSVAAVFQDVGGSIDPLFTVSRAIREGLPRGQADRDVTVAQLLADVALDPSFARRRPHQLSGGQRQRVAIARAIGTGAQVLLLDEPTSSLDAHLRLQITNLLNSLRQSKRLTYVVISHDFRTVARMCSQVAVMQQGKIVDHGPVAQLLQAPEHPYTRQLVDASTFGAPAEVPQPARLDS